MAQEPVTHRNRPSSVLDALNFLEPPSPILTSSQASRTCGFGEIPIFFDFSLMESSLASEEGIHIGWNRNPPRDSVGTMDTVDTVGTFGPIYRDLNPNVDQLSCLMSTQSLNQHAPSVAELKLDEEEERVDSHDRNMFEPNFDEIGQNLDLSLSYPSTPSITESNAVEVSIRVQDDFSQTALHIPNSLTTSTLSTLRFGPPSTYSTLSCPSSPCQTYDRSAHPGDLECPAQREIPESVETTALDPELHSRSTETINIASTFAPSSPLKSRPRVVPRKSRPFQMNPHAAIALSDNSLPENISWLRSTTVELFIDQEGFRSVCPSFKFVGYTSSSRSLDAHGEGVEGGAAQFMPTKRELLHFHYAPLDGLPILRRVTINGDESRDHILRQASLSLKSNGVYTVHGTETSSLHLDSSRRDSHVSTDMLKLRWKFDYLVNDRKAEGKSKVSVEGEKTLTPLTFSCSPLLFHPLQGKKIKLMHIVKKSVTAKLVSEKVEPPSMRLLHVPTPTLALNPIFTPHSRNIPPVRSPFWSFHRRAQSHAPAPEVIDPIDPHILMCQANGDKHENAKETSRFGQHYRRRRASSAAERPRRNMYDDDPLYAKRSAEQAYPSNNLVRKDQVPGRHIIPPSKLSKLMADIENAEPSKLVVATPVSSGLSPPPRRRYNPTRI